MNWRRVFRINSWQVFALTVLVSGQACQETNQFKVMKQSSLEAGDSSTKGEISLEQRRQALRRAKLILGKALPDAEELNSITDKATYESAIKELLASDGFLQSMREHHQKFFELKGEEDRINLNEPANLASLLIKDNQDYREILTAQYCVSDNGEKGRCSSFSRDEDQQQFGAGVVTTKGFLKKWEGPYNFRRTKHMFENFACKQYPDSEDPGMTEQEISESVKSFACNDGSCADQRCYTCHRTMNPRAALFYDFDRKGDYNTTPDPDAKDGEITLRDDMSVSVIGDLLNEGVVPRFQDKEVKTLREFAVAFSQSETFENCAIQRFTNYALGRAATSPIPTAFEQVRSEMTANGFRIKDFYFKLLTSDAYLQN